MSQESGSQHLSSSNQETLAAAQSTIYINENHDIAIAMSPSRADPVLGLNILLHCLGLFKYLNQCH